MTGQTCALPGCYKLPWAFLRQGDSLALACGNLHHQLLMAGRFNPGLPHPYQAILDRNVEGLCALPLCDEPPCLNYSWCSRTHYLMWLKEFSSSLPLDQICMLPGCTRHVYVDENSSASRFCGWRHKQKFVMRSALQHHQQEPLPSVEVPQRRLSLNKSECGHVPSLNSLMHSLEQFALHKIPPKNIRVIEDFYEMHPWEVVTEGHACWLIAGLKFTSKGRRLTTKGPYHWKQSGRRAKKSKDITGKYYTYAKRKGKEEEDDQQRAYTMQEYTMENIKCYSLIRLCKEKPSSDGKLKKEQRSNERQIAEQVDSVGSPTSMLCFWNDDVSGDSFYSNVLSPHDFMQDFLQYCADPSGLCLTGFDAYN